MSRACHLFAVHTIDDRVRVVTVQFTEPLPPGWMYATRIEGGHWGGCAPHLSVTEAEAFAAHNDAVRVVREGGAW